MSEKISYAKTVYGKEEIDAVLKCLENSTQMGIQTKLFEKQIANLFEKKECLFVNSGSSALHIGVEAFNFPKGGEVITPALTFGTTVSCLIKNNLTPVFVDVEPLTYCINIDQIEDMISNKTVAILAPDLLGNICNWAEIRKISDKYGLKVLHDSADTLGATIEGISVGAYSDMSITSFYGSHIINCAGNGGALCLNDKKVIERSKLLRSWGRSSSLFDEKSEAIENRFNIKLDGLDYDAKFVFSVPGYNLEGSEIGAAFGNVQLKKLENNIKVRQENLQKQCNYFNQYPEYFINPIEADNAKTGFLAFPLLINSNAPFARKDFQIYLENHNIQTRVCFTGNILRQPMMKNINKVIRKDGYPNADAVMERCVLLPLHHGMTNEMFDRLHSTIDAFVKEYC
jgi:CDP-6-deoxy-D-xylo-4-hexulose-3-dehydrase